MPQCSTEPFESDFYLWPLMTSDDLWWGQWPQNVRTLIFGAIGWWQTWFRCYIHLYYNWIVFLFHRAREITHVSLPLTSEECDRSMTSKYQNIDILCIVNGQLCNTRCTIIYAMIEESCHSMEHWSLACALYPTLTSQDNERSLRSHV